MAKPSGYGDPAMLAAAQELARSFKQGGSDYGSKNGGKKSKKSSAPLEYRPPPRSFGESRPALSSTNSNLPPPSQRRYENSLSANPFANGPGPIMGNRAMDFLSRQEKPKPVAAKPSVPQQKPAPTATATISSASVPPAMPPPVSVKKVDSSIATKTENSSITFKKEDSSISVNELIKVVETTSIQKKDTVPTGSQEVSRQHQADARSQVPNPLTSKPATVASTVTQQVTKESIMDTFFSLIDEPPVDKAVMDKLKPVQQAAAPVVGTLTGQPPINFHQAPGFDRLLSQTAPANKVQIKEAIAPPLLESPPTPHATTYTKSKNTSSVDLEKEILKKKKATPPAANANTGSLASALRPVGGKLDEMKSSEGLKLRPEAPGFVPRLVPRPDTPSEVANNSGVVPPSPYIEPSARETTPVFQDRVSEPPLGPSMLVPSGPASGHLVTVTPVHFANGLIIPGQTDGQLWLKTPVSTVSQPATPDEKNMSQTRVVQPTQKNPTKGLDGSMWAK